jgi:lysozyme
MRLERNVSKWLSWFKVQEPGPLPTPPEFPKLTVPEQLHALPVPNVTIEPPTGQVYKVSPNGLAFIKVNERFEAKAYLDSAGIPTIGYGTIRVNGQAVHLGMTCTQAQADAWLTAECNGICRAIQKLVTVPLEQNQIDALVDFCYNLGTDALRTSSLLRCINAKQPVVADLFTRWDKIHKDGKVVELEGLKERREREYTLYTS